MNFLIFSLLAFLSHGQTQDIHFIEENKIAQNKYFENSSEASFWQRANSCKYISSIFTPAIPRTVHFTFDDGPHPRFTKELLDVLQRENIKATFFVLGKNVNSQIQLLKRAQQEGHLIANHSFDHPNFHSISESDQVNQISTTDQRLIPYINGPKLFRYPFGNSTCFSNQLIKNSGYQGIVGWHVDTCDWAFAANGGFVTDRQAKICEVLAENKANFVGHVVQQVTKYNGGVILMHDVHEFTIDNVESLIFNLKKQGFSFMNLDDPRTTPFFR
jgi:peptidoglycan/xylan/chitin deacetylase (PgdA/CDA1 family)